jgi:formate-dependent nitrite reductase membrane component NrfD
MIAATGVLLIFDLKRPDRFHYIFLKPNPTSWLLWGSVALAAYAGVAGLWLLTGLVSPSSALLTVVAWLAVPTAALAAGYTGFLFGRPRGGTSGSRRCCSGT